jgi:HSP20 family protein
LVELFGEFPDRLRSNRWRPAVDVFETTYALVARIELPGVAGEDIHVNVEGDLLKVSGMRRPPSGGDVGRLHQMEIAFGPFERKVKIASPFERQAVSARLEDGVLSVTLPKKKAGAHTVKVETE